MTTPFTIVLTGQSLIHHDLRTISDDRLQAVTKILKAADVTFTNFESTVFGRHGGWPLKGSYFGCTPPTSMAALKEMGFNALALANNHAFDLGPSGILSTIEEAHACGFLHAGIGVDKRGAGTAAKMNFRSQAVALVAMDAGPGPSFMYAEDESGIRIARPGVNGLKVSRTFDVKPETFELLSSIQGEFQSSAMERANYAQPEDPPAPSCIGEIDFYGTIFRRAEHNARRVRVDFDSAVAQLAVIHKAASEGAFVIAYLHHHHWEPSWQEVPSWVQSFARDCVDAGARIFVSHGAPVLQPIEIYNDSPIFYGLGNFLFHTDHDETAWSPSEVWKSVIASCTFDTKGLLESIDLHPIVIGGVEALEDRQLERLAFPVLAEGHIAHDILDDLADRCQTFGTGLSREGAIGHISAVRVKASRAKTASGPFEA
jgi:poly-gamma-glutamate synthesis protein (capsule biosynthesis protein)